MRLRPKQLAAAIMVVFFARAGGHQQTRRTLETIFAVPFVPPAVRSVFEGSCNACHLSETRWPWYAHAVQQGRKGDEKA